MSRNTRRTVQRLGLVVVGMFAFGYALVPLYDVICQVTGLNGKTGRVESASVAPGNVDRSRWVTVEFTGTTMRGLPWQFRPVEHSVRVHPGEVTTVKFVARNEAGEPITGQAVPSVAPNRAATYFKKIECFCFSQQTLNGRESKIMPVQFVVDKNLPKDVKTITLAYSFFNINRQSATKYGGDSAETAAVTSHEHHQHAAGS